MTKYPVEYNSNDMTKFEVFVVEGHKRTSSQSVTSEVIADYLEQVVKEDADSYFVTSPGSAKEDEYEAHEPIKRPRSKKSSEGVPGKI